MKKIKQLLINENNTFNNLQKDIDIINYAMLKFIILTSMCVLAFLTIMSFIIEDFVPAREIYFYTMALTLILFFTIYKRPHHKILVLVMYIFISIFGILALYLSAIVSPDSQGASIIGILLLIPLVMIDKTWRSLMVSILLYLLFVVSSFIFKDFSVAIDDAVTGCVFTIAGNVLGYYMRSIKLDNITSQQYLKKLSDTDGLTRLYNRRKLDKVLKNETGYHPKGVIMLDVDFFKKYNDEYGHQAGDACLEEVGATLQRMSRLNHLKAYRYGGEEFLLLSDHHTYDELYMIANEIRKEIKRLQISFENSPFQDVTVTSGVSEAMICNTQNVKTLIAMADKALYHGKENGRNVVVGYTLGKR